MKSVKTIANSRLNVEQPGWIRADMCGHSKGLSSIKSALLCIEKQGFTQRRFWPCIHGFKFPNDFTNYVYDPFSFRTKGRCGGMCYVALDYFLAMKDIPDRTSLPPEGSLLAERIRERLNHSMLNTWSAFFHAMTSDIRANDLRGFATPPNGITWKTYCDTVSVQPCNIGLLPETGGIDALAGECHQVLGIGYSKASDPNACYVHIYDPNHPEKEMVLVLHHSGNFFEEKEYRYNGTFGPVKEKWRAWFMDTRYQPEEVIPPPRPRDISREDWRGIVPQSTDMRSWIMVETNFSGNHALNAHDFYDVRADGANFSGAGVSRANFKLASLIRARFDGADLKDATLDDAKAGDASFAKAQLNTAKMKRIFAPGADFNGAFLIEVWLEDARLPIANFHSATIDNADFTNAKLPGSKLNYCAIVNTSFEKARCQTCDFSNSPIADTKFIDTKLYRADFLNCRIADASFEGADLDEADFTGAVMNDVDFKNATMGIRSNFRRTSLDKVDFKNVKDGALIEAILSDCPLLANVDFNGIDLTESQFHGSSIRPGTNFKNATLDKADFVNANLIGAIFNGASIREANFSHASFRDCDFRSIRSADYRHSKWRGATFSNCNIPSDLNGYILANQ